MKLLFIFLILRMAIMTFGIGKVKCPYVWTLINYTWNSFAQMETAIESGDYNPKQCITDDGKQAPDGRTFITSPKEFGPGCPATLTVVSNINGSGGPLLIPYPNWEWHSNTWDTENRTCNGFVNVARLDMKCGYLFAMDTGVIGRNYRICDPKMVIIRLEDDTVVKTINIPPEYGHGVVVKPLAYLPSGDCSQLLDNVIIFMADYNNSGLVIHDSSTNRTCRVESDQMASVDPVFVMSNGEYFIYPAGIFSMTVICNKCNTNCYLYWAPIAGKAIYKIEIKQLLNCPEREQANRETKQAIKLTNQTVDMESIGQTLYYSDIGAMTIIRKNVCKKSWKNKTETVVQEIQPVLGVVTSMSLIEHGKVLQFVEDNYRIFQSSSVDTAVLINFRYCYVKV